MAGTMGVTQNANFIPEIWAQVALGKLESELHLAQNIARDSEFTSQKVGDTIHIPKRGTLTANDKAANTSVTLQNPTADKVDVTLNKHKEVSFAVEDIARAQENQDTIMGYVEDGITALAEQIEQDLAALYSSLSNSLGSQGSNISEDTILSARAGLTNNRAPRSNRFLYIDPSQVNVLLKLERFTSAEKYGTATPVQEGELGRIHGFRAFESIHVPTSGSPAAYHNMALHRNALVLATRPLPQPNSKLGVISAVVERNGIVIRVSYSWNADKLAEQVTLDVLYGVSTLRPELGYEIIT